MKILLIGKTGQLGGDILKNNYVHTIYAPERTLLDIISITNVEKVITDFKPDVLINTAAFHNVRLCETESERAFRINCIAVRDLAYICKQYNVLLVSFSTDYAFNGEKGTPYIEDDKPNPLQIYGISRVAGEYAALAVAPGNTIIIRTCGLYGTSGAKSKGGNFVDKRIQDAKNNTELDMSCEQIVSPTSTHALSISVLRLIEHINVKPGIYHLTCEGECSWYDFTKTIYKMMDLKTKVKPVDRKGMEVNMLRPVYSVLRNTKAKNLGITLPHWKESLEEYLNTKYGK